MPEQTTTELGSKTQDLTGKRFSRLQVLEFSERLKKKTGTVIYWLCRCDCGKQCVVEAGKLRSGHTKSCGCYQQERATQAKTIHGGASRKQKHRLYRLWRGMLERCSYREHDGWENYGGRGIAVCDKWKNFALFLEDMGSSYKEGLTIERKNGNGNYELSNCVWATPKEQAMNTRRNHILTVDGVSKPLQQWADETGAPRSLIASRVQRGWSDEAAIKTPRLS